MPPTNNDFLKNRYVEEYTDPLTGITGKQFKLGLWWFAHKSSFARVGLILLIIVDILLTIPSFYTWADYVVRGMAQDKQLAQSLATVKVTNPNVERPADIQVLSTSVFVGSGDHYDFAAELVNPNEEWIISFDYHFVYRGGETPWRASFLLPQVSTIRGELGFGALARPREARLELKNLKWQRITAHDVPDITSFMQERLRFSVYDAGVQGLPESNDSVAHFRVVNNTPYSYWNVPLYIGIGPRGHLEGVELVTLDQFKTGDERTVDVATTVTNGAGKEVFVFPALNIFDQSVYLPIGN
jgi:hypothetical protein